MKIQGKYVIEMSQEEVFDMIKSYIFDIEDLTINPVKVTQSHHIDGHFNLIIEGETK